MSEHTPGPWTAREWSGPQWMVTGPRGRLHAVCLTSQGNDEANARLIAAAPELLASALAEERMSRGFATEAELRAARAEADRLRRAAIAKALGGATSGGAAAAARAPADTGGET